MNDPVPSDTASDSDFDEQDFTAEEDDDSIAPDEDTADDEEIDSLVKESQMSLEDLLASYGLSVSDPVTQGTAAANVSTVSVVSRSGRRRTMRHVGRRPVSPGIERDPEQNAAESCVVQVKRNRRSSPSTSSVENISLNSIPLCIEKSAIENDNFNSLEQRRVSSLDAMRTPSDMDSVVCPNLPYSNHHNTRRTMSLYNTTDTQLAIHADGLQILSSTRKSHSNSPSPTSLVCPMDQDDDPQERTSISPAKDDGEESRDSGHEETYPTRFWKHALADDQSPPSYNSEDDEDYAPSLDSGHDWRVEIHIGDAFQASIPPYIPPHERTDLLQSWDTRRIESECSQLWQPGKLPEDEVIRFERLFVQSTPFSFSNGNAVDDEEALFLLMRCNYDPDEALQRLRFRAVLPSEIPSFMDTWSEADSVAFEKGFALYHKDFRQIRETKLKHKTVRELVHYYYLWKKTARYEEFIRVYRRDKRKSPHTSITEFMDCLVLEQEATATDTYTCHDSHNASAMLHQCRNEKTVRYTPLSTTEPSSLGFAQCNPNRHSDSADTAPDPAHGGTESTCPPDIVLSNSSSSRLENDSRIRRTGITDNKSSEETMQNSVISTRRLSHPPF